MKGFLMLTRIKLLDNNLKSNYTYMFFKKTIIILTNILKSVRKVLYLSPRYMLFFLFFFPYLFLFFPFFWVLHFFFLFFHCLLFFVFFLFIILFVFFFSKLSLSIFFNIELVENLVLRFFFFKTLWITIMFPYITFFFMNFFLFFFQNDLCQFCFVIVFFKTL
jgi:hypothetical protein